MRTQKISSNLHQQELSPRPLDMPPLQTPPTVPHNSLKSQQPSRASIQQPSQPIQEPLKLTALTPDWQSISPPSQSAIFQYFIQQPYQEILQSIQSQDSFQIHAALSSTEHLLSDQNGLYGILPLASFRISNIRQDFLKNQNVSDLQKNIQVWCSDLQKLFLHHIQNTKASFS